MAIQVLDQNTINKIAAGEVIERPSSVVKELVENAIDAKATAITVEIKEGGISFIRITDNGCGIDKADIPIAFLRHSTSKIKSVEDLLSISSLGFRGEALSSIASVSQIELITKTASSLTGVRYIVEGGVKKSMEDIGAPNGTTFIIRNLFYNTPARRKFLKSAPTEAGYISDLLEKLAQSHPDISFRFINNGTNKLHTSGNGNLKDVIYQVYGRDITGNLLSVSGSADMVSVTGFAGKPIITRGNRNYENYFINGRFIKSNVVSKAIEEAYKPYMMQHKYPFTVLHFTIDSSCIDVNVHPTKMELRFSNNEHIYNFVYSAVSDALKYKELIPDVSIDEKKDTKDTNEQKKQLNVPKTAVVRPPEPFEEKRQQAEKRSFVSNPEPAQPVKKQETDVVREKPEYETVAENPVQMEFTKLLDEKSVINHKIIGQVFDTYWLVQFEDKLFIIDQHAAHEKVLYEKFVQRMKDRDFAAQALYPPLIVSLNMQEEEVLKENMEIFAHMGFEIEHFGGKEYTISTVPEELFGLSDTEMFIEILDNLSEEGKKKNVDSIMDRIATMACKAAVKGNNRLSFEEAKALIDELLALENPYNCPHGRPTIISMSKYELEKKFKRIV